VLFLGHQRDTLRGNYRGEALLVQEEEAASAQALADLGCCDGGHDG